MKSLGDQLRAARAQKGWSLERTQAETGLDAGAISRFERGLREPGSSRLRTLAVAYGVSADSLLQMPVRGRRQRRG